MKVIDLLNEIVNGGKIPNKIKWNNNIFELKIDSIDGHFYYEKSEGMQSFVSMLETMQDLNDEVKLIEDKTIDINSIDLLENEVMKDDWRYYVPMFFNKINELIQAVKQLNKEIKELKEN